MHFIEFALACVRSILHFLLEADASTAYGIQSTREMWLVGGNKNLIMEISFAGEVGSEHARVC
jgi:hypothetical protein